MESRPRIPLTRARARAVRTLVSTVDFNAFYVLQLCSLIAIRLGYTSVSVDDVLMGRLQGLEHLVVGFRNSAADRTGVWYASAELFIRRSLLPRPPTGPFSTTMDLCLFDKRTDAEAICTFIEHDAAYRKPSRVHAD